MHARLDVASWHPPVPARGDRGPARGTTGLKAGRRDESRIRAALSSPPRRITPNAHVIQAADEARGRARAASAWCMKTRPAAVH